MKNTDITHWQNQRNIGPVMAPLLVEAGIKVEDLQKHCVEDIFLKFFAHHQQPRYVHSAYLYALHGAKHHVDWRAVPIIDKQRYQQFVQDFKASWQS